MPFGLPGLPLRRRGRPGSEEPGATWQRPIGLGWERPYTVRYASNLDDGPNHGAPLGGFGAGCIGRGPDGAFNLWHLDGGEHWFGTTASSPFSSTTATRARPMPWPPPPCETTPDPTPPSRP